MTAGSLSQRITNQLAGLKGLFQQLNEIRLYLEKVAAGQLPVNHQIIYLLQVSNDSDLLVASDDYLLRMLNFSMEKS